MIMDLKKLTCSLLMTASAIVNADVKPALLFNSNMVSYKIRIKWSI